MKLMGKEILIPESAHRAVFVTAPLVGLSGVLLLATMLWLAGTGTSFVGDIIVAIYLMVLPSLALILGSSASGSPHASVGAAREMKLVLGYELPLVLAFVVVIIKTAGRLEATEQLSLVALAQHAPVMSISGLLAFVVALLCVQAKLGFVPFDIAESETELASGVMVEYSGALLAVWQLMQAMMLVDAGDDAGGVAAVSGGRVPRRSGNIGVGRAGRHRQVRAGGGAGDPDQEYESAGAHRSGDAVLLVLLWHGAGGGGDPGDAGQLLRPEMALG
jgi:hypothetical protein